MTNILEQRAKRQGSGRAGRKAEGSLATRIAGRSRPGSGAMDGAKGDVTVETPDLRLLVENKTTVNDSMSLKKEWLLKIYREALEVGRVPALAIQFTNGSGASTRATRWVAVPEALFAELTGITDYSE